MTAQQQRTINHINEALEAERFIASQAAREVAELDAVAVLIAVEVKMQEGNVEAARALVQAWRASKRSN
jgi:hypothetical protein